MEPFVVVLGVFLISRHSTNAQTTASPPIQIQLSNGKYPNEGRVEIEYNSQWGTICNNGWTQTNADVVCKILGYQKALAYKRSFGRGNGKIWLDDVRCNGDEDSIAKCCHRKWGVNNCSPNEDVGVVCLPKGSPNIAIRLTNPSAGMGMVEVRYYNQWKTICSRQWNKKTANVVCKMAGFNGGVSAVLKGFSGDSDVWFTRSSCRGYETSLSECSSLNWGQETCTENNRAGVICKTGQRSLKPRLTNGSIISEGRLLVKYFGSWELVIHDYFNLKYANIMCRMMGYTSGAAAFYRSTTYVINNVHFWTNCNGREQSIEDCSTLTIYRYSSRSYGSWVICKPSPENRPTKVRLVSNGRVEIQSHGVWGHVCGNDWDIKDALVVCRMLSYKGAISAGMIHEYGTKNPIWLSSVKCKGNENDLLDCVHGQGSSCYRYYATAICHNSTEKHPNVAVRLVDGPTQGRVEVRYYGVWGTVCINNWVPANAHVICHMLGYSKSLSAYSAQVKGSGHILLRDVSCRGSETSLERCNSNSRYLCTHQNDVEVRCGNLTQDEKAVGVRIVGEKKNYGRVEINYKGLWDPVCGDKWGIQDSHVVCRMRGYKAALAGINKFREGNARQVTWVSEVECRGNERIISQCYHRGWNYRHCAGLVHAGVLCYNETEPLSLQVRLEDGETPHTGRVGIRFGNVWGTLCNKYLHMNDAKVICRMLGYFGVNHLYELPGNGTIWLSKLGCNGTERSIDKCNHSEWGQTDTCNHMNDVAITCKIADAPTVLINDFDAVKSTTAILVFPNATIDFYLNSTLQIVIKKTSEDFIFDPRNPPSVPSHNVTKATMNTHNAYIAAEIKVTNRTNRFVIGDDESYSNYHNAPLQPGVVYFVFVRIATRSTSGENVYGHPALLAFKTASANLKTNNDMLHIPKSIVIGVGVGMALLVLIFAISYIFAKRKRKTRKLTKSTKTTSEIQGFAEMQTRSTDGQYQSLVLPLQPPQHEEDKPYYMNSSANNRQLYSNDMVNGNIYQTDEVIYVNNQY